MEISVTLSANAGVALDIGGRKIWVDALHDEKVPGFSTLTPQLQREMMACAAFSHPEFICYTHLHPDHYSEVLTRVAQGLWPNARVLLPGQSTEEKGLQLRFVSLPHEGEQYRDVAHYGLIVSFQGVNILIPGDCEVASPALTEAVGDIPIHLALLNFPWLTLHRGKEYVQAHFPDTRLVVYHLPFAWDDMGGYRQAARSAAQTMGDVSLLDEPLQTQKIII